MIAHEEGAFQPSNAGLQTTGVHKDWRDDADSRIHEHVLALSNARIIKIEVVVEQDIEFGTRPTAVSVLKTACETEVAGGDQPIRRLNQVRWPGL
jgi:hypothetical protein